jgi:hypothetical protein
MSAVQAQGLMLAMTQLNLRTFLILFRGPGSGSGLTLVKEIRGLGLIPAQIRGAIQTLFFIVAQRRSCDDAWKVAGQMGRAALGATVLHSGPRHVLVARSRTPPRQNSIAPTSINSEGLVTPMAPNPMNP